VVEALEASLALKDPERPSVKKWLGDAERDPLRLDIRHLNVFTIDPPTAKVRTYIRTYIHAFRYTGI
jgi:exoribonuclease R